MDFTPRSFAEHILKNHGPYADQLMATMLQESKNTTEQEFFTQAIEYLGHLVQRRD